MSARLVVRSGLVALRLPSIITTRTSQVTPQAQRDFRRRLAKRSSIAAIYASPIASFGWCCRSGSGSCSGAGGTWLAEGVRPGIQLGRPRIQRKLAITPSVSVFNLFNLSNFDSAANALGGQLSGSPGSINGTVQAGRPDRIGAGTGVFAFGAPRTVEWGLKLQF